MDEPKRLSAIDSNSLLTSKLDKRYASCHLRFVPVDQDLLASEKLAEAGDEIDYMLDKVKKVEAVRD